MVTPVGCVPLALGDDVVGFLVVLIAGEIGWVEGDLGGEALISVIFNSFSKMIIMMMTIFKQLERIDLGEKAELK